MYRGSRFSSESTTVIAGLDTDEGGTVRLTKLTLAAVTALVTVRLLLHALFVPAYEGPDEPFHLGRVAAFADLPFLVAFRGVELDGAIVGSVNARPCAAARGCPAFGSEPASFNLLGPRPPATPAAPARNPENNQPPLFYMAAATLVRLAGITEPEARLLFVRLLNVFFVGVGLAMLLSLPGRRDARVFACLAGAALALPGASEALARCSNDAAVFLWASTLLVALARPEGWTRTAATTVLLAIGPLLKLTAFPVVVFALVALWTETKARYPAFIGGIASLAVFPVQFLRGWRWGGTYELNRPIPGLNESLFQTLLGFCRSAYAFVKTTFWLGGWSFFRAPLFLVILFFGLLVAIAAFSRAREPLRRAPAHLAGLIAAALGFVIFAVANRRFFGGWGGVGGWYFWSWFPWLAVAVHETRIWPRGVRAPLVAAGLIFVVLTNIIYYKTAYGIYR